MIPLKYRLVLHEAYLAFNAIAEVAPSNPCDIKGLADLRKAVLDNHKSYVAGLDELIFGELDSAREYFKEISKGLKKEQNS